MDTNVQDIQTKEIRKLQRERAFSAPEILHTEIQSSSPTIDQTESSIDFRDASTNT